MIHNSPTKFCQTKYNNTSQNIFSLTNKVSKPRFPFKPVVQSSDPAGTCNGSHHNQLDATVGRIKGGCLFPLAGKGVSSVWICVADTQSPSFSFICLGLHCPVLRCICRYSPDSLVSLAASSFSLLYLFLSLLSL